MPDKILDGFTALLYAIVAVSGASGGCMIAAHHALRGRNVPLLLLSAYALVGAVFAVAGLAVVVLFVGFDASFERLVLYGLTFGASGSVALASANFSVRFLLRRFGIEVDINVRRTGKNENH